MSKKQTTCDCHQQLAAAWCYAAYMALARSCLGLEAGQRKLKISNVYGCGVCIIYKCLLRMRTCG